MEPWYLTSGRAASRTATPVLSDAVVRADVVTGADGDRGQRQAAALEVVPVAVLERLCVAAVAGQSVQVGRARATAVGVVLLAAGRRIRADEHQPPVVHRRWLFLALAAAGRIGTTLPAASDQVQRLQALQVLRSATGPRVRSAAPS